MDNCYGKSDRIPRELLHKDDRMTNKHIQTLSFLQDMVNENALLKQRKDELEKEQEKCQEIHAMAEDSQLRIKDIEDNCLKRADEVNQMLADQHRNEMMQVLDEKSEMERDMKEEILKLRHELASLKQTNTVLQKDTEWRQEKHSLQERITELELLAEGLQMDVAEKKFERKTLQTFLSEAQAMNSELHQLQNLRTMNQALTGELEETHQKNQEFALKIEKLQRELTEQSAADDHVQLMEALNNKTAKLLREKGLAVMRAEDARSQCEGLEVVNDDLKDKRNHLQQECANVARELVSLQVEHGKVTRRLLHSDEDDAANREYWAIKRELSALKDDNEILRLKAKAASSSCSLPQLKDDQNERPVSVSKPKGKKKKLLSVSSTPGESSPMP
ncbi:hypothetical protein ACOMHN_010966 [Nucella lapillus]